MKVIIKSSCINILLLKPIHLFGWFAFCPSVIVSPTKREKSLVVTSRFSLHENYFEIKYNHSLALQSFVHLLEPLILTGQNQSYSFIFITHLPHYLSHMVNRGKEDSKTKSTKVLVKLRNVSNGCVQCLMKGVYKVVTIKKKLFYVLFC